METFLISLLVFALAFAAMAIGSLRGRPLGAAGRGGCRGCAVGCAAGFERGAGEDGGMRCPR